MSPRKEYDIYIMMYKESNDMTKNTMMWQRPQWCDKEHNDVTKNTMMWLRTQWYDKEHNDWERFQWCDKEENDVTKNRMMRQRTQWCDQEHNDVTKNTMMWQRVQKQNARGYRTNEHYIRHIKFDFTTVADRLWTVRWNNISQSSNCCC